MPAVTVTTARGVNRCGGAGSGLGCCAIAQSGLGTGRGSCQQWLVLWLRPLEAMGGGGGGIVKLSKPRARVGKALRRLRRGGDEVKLGNFARLAKFRYLAKFNVPSEIHHFRYLSYFSLG